jgi:hypothetical protein
VLLLLLLLLQAVQHLLLPEALQTAGDAAPAAAGCSHFAAAACAASVRLLAAAVAVATCASPVESQGALEWLYTSILQGIQESRPINCINMRAFTARGISNSRFTGLPTWDAQQ